MILTHKYRLKPSYEQEKELEIILEGQRILYNAALEERSEAYKKNKISISLFDQYKSLTEIRQDDDYSALPANLQRSTLNRLNEAFKGFFNRVKKGDKAGFPRFKSQKHWKSFGFTSWDGIKIKDKKLKFKGITGSLKVLWHRELPSIPKTVMFKKDCKGWLVYFVVEVGPMESINTSWIGVDLGLTNLGVLSSGEEIKNLRFAKKSRQKIKILSRKLARCKRGSNNGNKIKNRLARAHNKIFNQRDNHLHQISADLVKRFGVICIEDLNVKKLSKGYLAASFGDAAIGKLINFLRYKAERAGIKLIEVDPRYTSQECSGCGVIKKKSLWVRTHSCPCGLTLDRDHNAAINILNRGGLAPKVVNATPLSTKTARVCVDLESKIFQSKI